jgi:hypothetical protein
MARTRTAQFQLVSDEFAGRTAAAMAVKAYHALPRVTIFESSSPRTTTLAGGRAGSSSSTTMTASAP